MSRSVRSINSEFFREVASELDDQRGSIARCVGLFEEAGKAAIDAQKQAARAVELFDEARRQVIKLQGSLDRTHSLLIDQANKLGTDIVKVSNRIAHVERMTGVTPSPAE